MTDEFKEKFGSIANAGRVHVILVLIACIVAFYDAVLVVDILLRYGNVLPWYTWIIASVYLLISSLLYVVFIIYLRVIVDFWHDMKWFGRKGRYHDSF